MSVKMIATIQVWEGLSTDAKPTATNVGSKFHELDTGKDYVWTGDAWALDMASPLTTGRANELVREVKPILEQLLIEVNAANEANGIFV